MAKAEKYSVVGQRVHRVEGYDKVTGESKYVADVALPGMLTGKILRSPYPHAKILRIDTSSAEKLRGVRAVVTAEDTIKRPWGAFFADQYILSVGKARYVGEAIAACVASEAAILRCSSPKAVATSSIVASRSAPASSAAAPEAALAAAPGSRCRR